jgi:phosphohistidine swiveling domain-containing protein
LSKEGLEMSNDQSVPLVLALDDPAATLEQVGGKGASLARLAAAGLPVPPGFHITTTAYRSFVTENGLQEQILATVSAAPADQPTSLEEASSKIGRMFAQRSMPAEIAAAIRQAYIALGGDDLCVAVRSSATAEDLPELSFAGQQETYLNMRGEAMVLDAIKRCWASLWTARAIGYRARSGIAHEEVSLAVVVQELVPADAAGILFTANPLTGERDQVMINAAWGLGEAIVGGQVTPDTVAVDRASGLITAQQISVKEVMTVRTPEGTSEEPVPVDKRTSAVLTAVQAAQLASIGVRIEELYRQPMDIEWALSHNRFFIVQARPITALPKTAGLQVTRPPEWKLPKPKGKYIRASVIELLPDPLSPLFATLGLPAWNRAMKRFALAVGMGKLLDDMLTTINGYAFYDLRYRTALMKPKVLTTVVPRLMYTAQRRWEQEARPAYKAVVERWEAVKLSRASAAEVLVGTREILNAAASYYLTIQSGILPAAFITETIFTIVYEKLLKRRADPSALTFMLGYDSAPIRAEESLYDLAQWVRTQDDLSIVLQNMSGVQFASAYQTAHVDGIDEPLWSAFCQRFTAHLAQFGHAIYDLDFSKPVPADDPVALLETLKFFLSGNAPDPHARQAASKKAREHAMQMMLNRLRGPSRSLFRRLVGIAQRFAPLREDGLADVGLGWPVLRRMVREIGQRLATRNAISMPDDVFWLTQDELLEAVIALDGGQSPANYRTPVSERRTTWEGERMLTPPIALPLKGGTRFLGMNFSSLLPARTGQPAGDVLKGIATSPGYVTGVARVIHGADEFAQMRQGDILVARITTPAWTSLFALAAGVVTDVGGPLSHSSIVAREYHIPAVLGTGVATERLHTGQNVTVDGDAGTVTLSR